MNRKPLAVVLSISLFAFSLAGCAHIAKRGTADAAKADPDTKRVYAWVSGLQLENGLLESCDGSNFVSLYENALAAIVFSARGDLKKAEKILDYFDRNIGELEQAPGGFGQFRDRAGAPLDGAPHRWLGDNAWLLIAVNNYHGIAGNGRYSKLSSALEKWIRSLQDPKDGGLWGGYDRSGKQILKSAEGIIDSFNAVKGYDGFHRKIIGYLKNGYWDPEKKVFLAWKEHEKYKYALDLHSWGYCAFPRMPQRTLDEAAMFLTSKKIKASGIEITGFCFDLDHDSVWLEGTGEMAVAYRSAGRGYTADFYLDEMGKALIPSVNEKDGSPARAGLPYATNPGTHYGTGKLWDGVDTNLSLAASAWYLFGKMHYDPMEPGRKKSIPAGDMFWVERK